MRQAPILAHLLDSFGFIVFCSADNHQYSVGEKKQTGLAAVFLILGTCAGGAALLSMYYYKRRTQKRQGTV